MTTLRNEALKLVAKWREEADQLIAHHDNCFDDEVRTYCTNKADVLRESANELDQLIASLPPQEADVRRDAARWRFVRAADADAEQPYVCKSRVDSWGNTKDAWLMHNDADKAVDAAIDAALAAQKEPK